MSQVSTKMCPRKCVITACDIRSFPPTLLRGAIPKVYWGPNVLSPTWCICVLVFVFVFVYLHVWPVLGVLVPRAFQKYSTCLVHSDSTMKYCPRYRCAKILECFLVTAGKQATTSVVCTTSTPRRCWRKYSVIRWPNCTQRSRASSLFGDWEGGTAKWVRGRVHFLPWIKKKGI